MAKRLALWNSTSGLFAIAAALLVLALTIDNSRGRYQFATSSLAEGQAVWRGDTISGRVDLCATELVTGQMRSSDVGKTIVTKC